MSYFVCDCSDLAGNEMVDFEDHDSDDESGDSGEDRMKRDEEPAAESNKMVEKEKSD